jgi:site-specific DNA recombinase
MQAEEDRVSIEAQLSDCESHCQQRGYVVVARYVEREKYRSKGKLVQPSGQRKDRLQYQAMLTAARNGEFDVIVAWKEDRLYRGMYAAIPFSEVLDELGKRLEVDLVRETFDRKMLGIKAALGKIESDNIRERMIMGKRVHLERGEMQLGGDQVKYGYCKVNGRLEIDKAEAATVRKIFDWYIAGERLNAIISRLNMLGVPTRKGGQWNKGSVQGIIRGEWYATGKLVKKLDGITYELPCPPILSTDVWQRSLTARDANRYVAKNLKEDYLCVGLVYCACGWKMQVKTYRPNVSKGFPDYMTGGYRCQHIKQHFPDHDSSVCVGAPGIGSKKLDSYVWNYVKELCGDPQRLQRAIAHKIAKLQSEAGDIEAEAERLQGALDKLSEERHWVITQARKKAISEDDMSMQIAALQFQELGYRKELDEKKMLSKARQQTEALSVWARDYLANIHAGIEALGVDPAKLSEAQREALSAKLEAGRFLEKFGGDALAALRWAMLEERRRVVRTLIGKVEVARNGKERIIRPILALEMPADGDDFSAYGDQSPHYKISMVETVR